MPKAIKRSNTLAIHGGAPVRKKFFPAYKPIDASEERAVVRVVRSGILSRYLGCWDPDFYGGPECQAFEKSWALYFGVKHALAINSCTSGLQAAVGAIGINPGDEVIVSPYTMAASATAPLLYGGIPVFADVEPDYFCLDPKSVESRITPRTKAIIVVDIFGQPHDAAAFRALAKKYHLSIIEDCAQAPYAKLNGKFAGTLGDIGVYSLNYHKHIHTGEGGIVVTNDDRLAERVRLIRNHAEAVVGDAKIKNLTNMVGFNFRMTEMQAAIGRVALTKLKKLVSTRMKNCSYLAERLSDMPGIRIAPTRAHATHAYYLQPFLFDEQIVGVSRDRFIKAVKAELPATKLREQEGTLIGCGYVAPLYLLPLFQQRTAFGSSGYPFTLSADPHYPSYARGICPVAEALHDKILFTHELMRPPMTERDLDDVVKAFHKVYAARATLVKRGT